LLKNYFRLRYFASAAKAAFEKVAVIAALKRCATQNRIHPQNRNYPKIEYNPKSDPPKIGSTQNRIPANRIHPKSNTTRNRIHPKSDPRVFPAGC
jgi:hypothetical protein